MTGLREKNKAKRRAAILDAAVELLNVHPWHEVPNEQIAARAEVAPATVYNLVGTRERLLTGHGARGRHASPASGRAARRVATADRAGRHRHLEPGPRPCADQGHCCETTMTGFPCCATHAAETTERN